ncbi:hypothetical protein EBR96_06310, partial [bacterium]|nr:hypothetical protein [bacterium]
MLVFLRKHAALIAGTMVTVLVVTLLVGIAFSKQMGKGLMPSRPEDSIATLGPVSVSAHKYSEVLNQLAARYRIGPNQKMDPEFIELLQYTAFE